MKRQKPTPVGRSGYVGTAARRIAAAMDSISSTPAMGLSMQRRGKEQISALFEKGVIVPIRGSVEAHSRRAPSQSPATIVAELSSTTSADELAMPRFAV